MSKPILAIIGGGASGLAAAIEAARKADGKCGILLLEALPRCGKKILASGNGRCNLSNKNVTTTDYHGDISLLESVFSQYSPASALSFFQEIGLFLRADTAGRVYPLSLQASAVLDALRFEAEKQGVKMLTQTKVLSIERTEKAYRLNGEISAQRVVIACGGMAAPVHGSDGSGYRLLEQLGVPVTPIFPALTPLCIDRFPKSLKGVRADGKIDIRRGGKTLASATGEIQYTEYGLSGIPAMQVSRAASEHFAMQEKGDCLAVVDRVPTIHAQELRTYILNALHTRKTLLCEDLLTGILPKRLGMSVLSDVSIPPQKTLSAINTGAAEAIVNSLKNKKYKVNAVCGFQDAQVTAGGVSAGELNEKTLELTKAPGVHVCGEIINIDGDCGGYNLLWAWNSGRLAGRCAAEGCLC